MEISFCTIHFLTTGRRISKEVLYILFDLRSLPGRSVVNRAFGNSIRSCCTWCYKKMHAFSTFSITIS